MYIWAPSTWELNCGRRKSISLQDARWTVLKYTCVVTSGRGNVGATLSCGIEVGGNELPSSSPESPLRYRTPMIFLRLALLPKGEDLPIWTQVKRHSVLCSEWLISIATVHIGWRGETPTFQKILVTEKIAKHLYSLEQISAVSKNKTINLPA